MLAAAIVACAFAPAAVAGSVGSLEVRGSVEQVQVTGAEPGERIDLLRRGREVGSKRAGELGGIVYRKLDPGPGYRVRRADGSESGRVRVLTTRSRPPDRAIYEQELPAGGYGYLETRDGTELAINVHLPGPAEDGPYPTLVEYSGYGYADPAGPESGIAPVAELLGYAVVDVNMRGTGCSGGAFDYFEYLQSLDGYDVVETVARQPWVMHNHVGMLGISYGGISQLFTAQTRPPSLAAITPLSVIDDTLTTLYPGGILNTGFALEWAQDRVDDSQAAGPDSGQPWAWKRIQEGDGICKANQDLHPEAVDLIAKTRRNTYYRPKIVDPLSPATFVDEIDVPVYLACQWQDEQTGGHCPALADEFTGTDRKWFTFTNGTHSDSLDPATFNRLFDFLELYVAKRRPELPPGLAAFASVLYSALMGVDGVNLPDDPIRDEPDFDSALAAFERLKRVRVLFENGAGAAPGAPVPTSERSFRRLPVPGEEARSWYLAGGGKLSDERARRGAEKFRWDPDARPPTNFTGNTGSGSGGLWTASPEYEWSQPVPGKALSYMTAPLDSDTAVVGAGELQLWVRSSAPNVDLQATVSEVRADGKETFVQGGWLRTAARKIDREQSRLMEPRPSYRKRDERTLPSGRWVKVRIPLYFQGHLYRQDSRLRVTVSAPGGDQPVWAFAETSPEGEKPWVAVAHSRKLGSRLVLPVKDRVGVPAGSPPCPGLRGQPCRDFEPFENERFVDRRTRWICKPGLEDNPCRTGLRTTLLSRDGEPAGEDRPRRSRPRPVDCFYVYPTVSDQPTENANRKIDPELRSIALYQAARYNQHCRVFAPVYRQVTLAALGSGGFTEENVEIAYGDVRRAWREYSRGKRRSGRGVVLIGHSQGAGMLARLIAEEIDPKRSERRRLVTAILLGGNVTVEEGSDRGGSFERIRECRRERQLGCVLAFVTYNEAVPPDAIFGRTSRPGEEVICTNPAALGGGPGSLKAVYPTEPFAPSTIGTSSRLIGMATPGAETPWYEARRSYVGECSDADGANVLQVSGRPGAPELRPIPTPEWGLHLADANIALGNLVDLVGEKASRYAR